MSITVQRLGMQSLIGAMALTFIACGAGTSSTSSTTSSTDSTDSTSDSSGGSTTTVSATSVANSAPSGDVVISSVTATVAASSNIAVNKVAKATGDNSISKKKEVAEALLSGENDCAFTLSIPSNTSPSCYGPQVLFCNHDNATETDNDCNIPQGGGPSNSADDGQLPTGDLGIWSASEGTTACSAAQANYLIDDVAAKVDTIINMFNVMVCVAKKNEQALPTEEDGELDMSTLMAGDTMKVDNMTVTSAKIVKKANNGDNPVYESTMEVSMVFANNSDPAQSVSKAATTTQTAKMVLTHSPTATGDDPNATYVGDLNVSFSNDSQTGGNCPQGAGTVSAGTIYYEKASATDVKYEYNWGGDYCTTDLDAPFTKESGDADTIVSGSASGADQYNASTNADGWGNNYNYGRFAINPSEGTGSVAYAWQAGQGDGWTRVINISTAQATDGSGSGTAYFGFGPDIGGTAATSSVAGVGSITGFFCNWAGPGNSKTPQITTPVSALAQKQVLTRAVGATDFTASSSNITFAPTNNCSTDGGMIFHAAVSQNVETVSNNSNDANVATGDNNYFNETDPLTHNLVEVTAVDFTVPAAPTKIP
jgi:hypothetical protein